MFSKQVGHISRRTALRNAVHAPAADTAAVITLAAAANTQHFINGVQWSYSTSPTAGRLTITVNAVTVFDVSVTGSGPGGFNFAIPGGTNQAIVITLAAGSGSCVGKINCQYTSEPTGSE